MSKKLNVKLIALSVTAAGLLVAVTSNKVYAEDCEPNYGGGETCILNKSFRITKDVRKEGDENWKDKVTDVDKDEVIEFRIKVKNVGEVKVDKMSYKDKLPSELHEPEDGLTEDWNDFEPGETKEFKFKTTIKDVEFERDNFEKCVVNKVSLYYRDAFEGADTATVCYKKGEISELPETGASAGIALSGLGTGLTAFGLLIRKKFNA